METTFDWKIISKDKNGIYVQINNGDIMYFTERDFQTFLQNRIKNNIDKPNVRANYNHNLSN